jgi:RND family efflux transporter MFP subunit
MPLTFVRIGALAALGVAVALVAGCKPGGPGGMQMPPPVVTTVHPVMVPVQSYYEYNGHLETTHGVEVRARVKGILKQVLFKEGTEVKAGDPLYTIDDREYKTAQKKAIAELEKAKADIENWKAQIDLAKAELKRANLAASASATAQTDVDKAKATLGVNVAQLGAAEASKDAAASALHTTEILLGYTDIRAPIDGRISRTHVDQGNLVGQAETTLLTTIVRVDELYVYFDVPEPDLMAYQQALRNKRLPDPSSGQIDLEVGVATEEGYPHKGKIDFRENRVDPGTGTVRLRGRIPNPPGPAGPRLLYPGLYAKVRVPSELPHPRPVIPEEALMTGQEGRYVFVVGADKKVAKRIVVVGPQVYRAPPPEENQPSLWSLNNPKPPPPPPPPGEAPKGPPMPPPPARVPIKSLVAIDKGLEPGDLVIVEGLQKTRAGGEVTPDTWEMRGPGK